MFRKVSLVPRLKLPKHIKYQHNAESLILEGRPGKQA
jgi:predicted SPOUT superfamily RNA methylase MTH1